MCTSAVKAPHLFLTFSPHAAELELQGTRWRTSERGKEGEKKREERENNQSIAITQISILSSVPSLHSWSVSMALSINQNKQTKKTQASWERPGPICKNVSAVFLSPLGHLLEKISSITTFLLKFCMSFRIFLNQTSYFLCFTPIKKKKKNTNVYCGLLGELKMDVETPLSALPFYFSSWIPFSTCCLTAPQAISSNVKLQ